MYKNLNKIFQGNNYPLDTYHSENSMSPYCKHFITQCSVLSYIIQDYSYKSYFTDYINNNYKLYFNHINYNLIDINSLWYYTRFIIYDNFYIKITIIEKNIIRYNYILHKLRCKAKKIINRRKILF